MSNTDLKQQEFYNNMNKEEFYQFLLDIGFDPDDISEADDTNSGIVVLEEENNSSIKNFKFNFEGNVEAIKIKSEMTCSFPIAC